MMFNYLSGKRWENLGSYALRQPLASSHCKLAHGYSPSIEIEFGTNKLDERGWVVDFGSLKSLKSQLEDMFDHTLLVPYSDPLGKHLEELANLEIAKLVFCPSVAAEGLAKFIFDLVNGEEEVTNTGWLSVNGYSHVWCTRVKFEEKPGNFAIYQHEPYEDWKARNVQQ